MPWDSEGERNTGNAHISNAGAELAYLQHSSKISLSKQRKPRERIGGKRSETELQGCTVYVSVGHFQSCLLCPGRSNGKGKKNHEWFAMTNTFLSCPKDIVFRLDYKKLNIEARG